MKTLKAKALIIVGIAAAALVAVGFTVPVVTVPYETVAEFQGTETYYEREPYEVTETYTENEPITETYYETVSLKYKVAERISTEGFPPGQYLAIVEITNTDDFSGYFTFTWLGISPYSGTTYPLGSPKLLAPGQRMSPSRQTFTPEIGNYSIETSTKTVEKTRILGETQVEKERTVTLYRDVKKTRPVTLQNTVTEYKKVPLILSWFD